MIRRAFAFIPFFVVLISMVFVLSEGAYACSVSNKVRTNLGVSQGFRGDCSNNGFSVTCVTDDDYGLSCVGPGGTYSGTDLDSLVFSACDCNKQEEREKERLEQLRDY